MAHQQQPEALRQPTSNQRLAPCRRTWKPSTGQERKVRWSARGLLRAGHAGNGDQGLQERGGFQYAPSPRSLATTMVPLPSLVNTSARMASARTPETRWTEATPDARDLARGGELGPHAVPDGAGQGQFVELA